LKKVRTLNTQNKGEKKRGEKREARFPVKKKEWGKNTKRNPSKQEIVAEREGESAQRATSTVRKPADGQSFKGLKTIQAACGRSAAGSSKKKG